MFIAQVKGVESVVARLKQDQKARRKALFGGLKKGGLFVQRESQKIVPVRYGDLKRSAFTRASDEQGRKVVSVGYTVEYAIYVHENLDNHHEIGQAKFLEDAANNNKTQIVQVVRQHVQKVMR